MLKTRVIPVLLIIEDGLYKTIKFKDPTYIGDPINAVKIFNDKEVDEIIILDITASSKNSGPNFDLIENIATECFMPICYGGGVSCIEDFHQLFRTGVEKVSINTAAIDNPELITEASDKYGSQSVIVSIDVRKDPLGKYWVYRDRGKNNTRMRVTDWANEVEELGAGEIFLNNVDRDGTYGGYDTTLIRRVTSKLNIPVIACGGARSLEDLSKAVENGGASAVAAGSLFVYWGKKKGILINYPSRDQLEKVLV